MFGGRDPFAPIPPYSGSSSAFQEGTVMALRVGKPAPNFEASAYEKGEIRKVKLEDYRGQWVMLYFYPGDFTFV
jgi:hypothetical protein